jgi:predicted signal transduction protein with EAL and GGDEF domain
MLERDAFIARLDAQLADGPNRVAVLLVAVESGLRALGEVARRLDTLPSRDEHLTRIDATTFAILCHAPAPAARAVTLTSRARALLRAPARVEGHLVHVGVQTGFATVPAHGLRPTTSADLLDQASASVQRRLRAAG